MISCEPVDLFDDLLADFERNTLKRGSRALRGYEISEFFFPIS